MPAGRFVGATFFTLLALAALTPAIGLLEPAVAWLQDRGMGRKPAAVVVCASGWLLGLGSVLSFNIWAQWHPLGWLPGFRSGTFFDNVDVISASVLMPLGALLTSVLVGWVLPRSLTTDASDPAAPRLQPWLLPLLRFVCPAAILVVLWSAFSG
jgi:NSS family neurotransmitter:Na+ symporter